MMPMRSAEQFLREIGITNFAPGFLDDPAFLTAEAADPLVLEKYAEFIEERSFDGAYLKWAKERVSQLLAFMHPLLVKEGRLGACVDVSGALARMLECDGIWCYCVNGALSIYPDSWTGVAPFHYAPISNQTQSRAAHSWVVAPPFRIIDLTVKLQPAVSKRERELLPDYILAETTTRVKSEPRDWIDPPIWSHVAATIGHEPTMADIPRFVGQHCVDITEKFGTWEVRSKRARFRYMTVAFGGCKERLPDIRNIRFAGDLPLAAYEKFCVTYPKR
jgi:hypothetical protein